jgi:hypothetical protein
MMRGAADVRTVVVAAPFQAALIGAVLAIPYRVRRSSRIRRGGMRSLRGGEHRRDVDPAAARVQAGYLYHNGCAFIWRRHQKERRVWATFAGIRIIRILELEISRSARCNSHPAGGWVAEQIRAAPLQARMQVLSGCAD